MCYQSYVYDMKMARCLGVHSNSAHLNNAQDKGNFVYYSNFYLLI